MCEAFSTGMPASSSFDLQPTLRGHLLEIRPMRADDFKALFAAASDPLIWEQHPDSERYKREVFQKFLDSAMKSGGAFAVIELASGKIIGSSRYWNLDLAASEVEIGWTFLERAFWGGRYNGELKRLMIDHALRFVDHVLFIADENNLRSQKALEKIGARYVKTLDRPSPDGVMRRNVVFAVEKWAFGFVSKWDQKIPHIEKRRSSPRTARGRIPGFWVCEFSRLSSCSQTAR